MDMKTFRDANAHASRAINILLGLVVILGTMLALLTAYYTYGVTTEQRIAETARHCAAKMSPDQLRNVIHACVAYELKEEEDDFLSGLIKIFVGIVCKEIGDAAK